MSDARTGKRFALKLPITIYEGQSSRKHAGTTSNVSAAGVYVWADKAFKVGTRIRFEITLPGQIIGSKRNVEIECRGRVVRADKGKPPARKRSASQRKESGVACVIDQYRFIRK